MVRYAPAMLRRLGYVFLAITTLAAIVVLTVAITLRVQPAGGDTRTPGEGGQCRAGHSDRAGHAGR